MVKWPLSDKERAAVEHDIDFLMSQGRIVMARRLRNLLSMCDQLATELAHAKLEKPKQRWMELHEVT